MKHPGLLFLFLVTVLAVGLAGCTTTQKGAAAGGAIGAGTGALIAANAGVLHAGDGALVGLATGGAAGALAGDAYEHYYKTPAPETTGAEAENLKNQVETQKALIQDLQQQLQDSKQREQKLQDQLQRLQDQLQSPNVSQEDLDSLKQERDALAKRLQEEAARRAELEKKLGDTLAAKDAELQDLRKRLGKGISVNRGKKGITLTFAAAVLFDSGKATLKQEGIDLLHRAAAVIRESYPNNKLNIEGHTDNVPIRYSKWKSNWELSAARALSVLHYLIDEEGFRPELLSFSGYADTQPVASNDTEEGRQKNRRAVIVILPEIEFKKQRLEL